MKKILFVIVFIGFTLQSRAQDFQKYFYASWDMNKPLTNTRDWIGSGTGLGAKLGYRNLINDNFSYGLDISWGVYNQYEPKTTFLTESGALTTDYFKYTYSYGIQISGQYYLPVPNKRKWMPFVGLAAGAMLNRYALYYNVYNEQDNGTGFLLSPQIGILFPFGGRIGAMISGHYDYSTAESDYFQLDGFSHMGINLGIVFMTY